MKRKLIVRNLLVACMVFMLVVAGITVLVLAASGDSATPKNSSDAAPSAAVQRQAEPEAISTFYLTPQEDATASIEFVFNDEAIPFETVYEEDDTLPKGVQAVLSEGAAGTLRYTTECILHNGIAVSSQLVGAEVVAEPQTRVVRVGTYVKPPRQVVSTARPIDPTSGAGNFLTYVTIDEENNTISTPSGEVYHYSSSITGEATAYSCEGEANPITATGTHARVGAVAVDPSVIPLGTRMFILLSDGSLIYGYCVAEDTGGAVKGNIIDLYMNTIADCSLVGRSACTVYFLT